MTRAVGNHSSASADYSLLRKMRFLSCRNSIMKKEKKKIQRIWLHVLELAAL